MSQTQCPECGSSVNADEICSACLLLLGTQVQPSADESGVGAEKPGDLIGRYQLLKVLGEGGFGTVWVAEQREPVRRHVALKIIKLGMDTKQVVARFEAERQALAMMEHPNIARVFDGGATDLGRPFFVMELVHGVPITEFCDSRKLHTRERLELLGQVCEAVQHAHQKGVIHRDLKPSNILVAESEGRPVPKVIDFGIAKATEQPFTERTIWTHFNQLLGTPAYMSPEQASGGERNIDTRTDVYSLGVLLYELITGRTPLEMQKLLRDGLAAAQKAIRETEPPKPSTRLQTLSRDQVGAIAAQRNETPVSLHRTIRGELDWITLKAIAKDPAARYQTANALAADVQRFLRSEPVTAAPPSFGYQFTRFARRNRAALAIGTAFILVLVAAVVVSTWQALRATKNLAQARLNAYASEMNVAQQAFTENNLDRTLQLLDRQRPAPGQEDLRGFEWRYLWQLCQPKDLVAFTDGFPGSYSDCALEISPGGRWLVYNGTSGVIVRELESRQIVTQLPFGAHFLSFSPDDRLLATSRLWDGAVRFWETATWQEVQVGNLANSIAPAVFSPDGRWLIAGSVGTNLLQLWNTATWEVTATCPGTPLLSVSLRSAVTFSPDSQWVVTPWMQVARDGSAGLHVWKVPSLEKHADLFVPDIPLQGARFLPDGRHLVTTSWLGHLLVWDMSENPPRLVQKEHEHTTYIPTLVVSSASPTFATGSADQSICLWDARTRKRVARWRGHRREVWGLGMTPKGDILASCGTDGTVRLWRGYPEDTGELIMDAGDIAGFSSDGRTLVLAPGEDNYRWQLVTETNRLAIPIPAEPPLTFQFHHPYAATGTNPFAALGRINGQVELWDLASQQLIARWRPGTNGIGAVAFSPDGSRLAAGDWAGFVRFWDTKSGAQLAEFKPLRGGYVNSIVYSSDGAQIAIGNQNQRQTAVWDAKTLRKITAIDAAAEKIAFSPDGMTLVTCTVAGNEARLWDLPSGREKAALKGHVGGINEAVFSPDGRTLATGAYDGRIKLWNTAMGQEVATLPYPGLITALQFSPDGRTLAVSVWTSPGHRAVLFRAPLLSEITEIEKRARSAGD